MRQGEGRLRVGYGRRLVSACWHVSMMAAMPFVVDHLQLCRPITHRLAPFMSTTQWSGCSGSTRRWRRRVSPASRPWTLSGRLAEGLASGL